MGWQYIPYQARFLFIPFSYLCALYLWVVYDSYRADPEVTWQRVLKDAVSFPLYFIRTRGLRRGTGLTIVNVFMLFMFCYLGWFSTTKTFLTDSVEIVYVAGEDSRIPMGVKPANNMSEFKSGDLICFIYENLVPLNAKNITYEVYSDQDKALIVKTQAQAPMNWIKWKQATGSFKLYGRGDYTLKIYLDGKLKGVRKLRITI